MGKEKKKITKATAVGNRICMFCGYEEAGDFCISRWHSRE
jgi:hypothetical protein